MARCSVQGSLCAPASASSADGTCVSSNGASESSPHHTPGTCCHHHSLGWLCRDTWICPHLWGPHFLLLFPLLQTCLVPTPRLDASHSTQGVWNLICDNKLSLFPKDQWATSVSPGASLCPEAAPDRQGGQTAPKLGTHLPMWYVATNGRGNHRSALRITPSDGPG